MTLLAATLALGADLSPDDVRAEDDRLLLRWEDGTSCGLAWTHAGLGTYRLRDELGKRKYASLVDAEGVFKGQSVGRGVVASASLDGPRDRVQWCVGGPAEARTARFEALATRGVAAVGLPDRLAIRSTGGTVDVPAGCFAVLSRKRVDVHCASTVRKFAYDQPTPAPRKADDPMEGPFASEEGERVVILEPAVELPGMVGGRPTWDDVLLLRAAGGMAPVGSGCEPLVHGPFDGLTSHHTCTSFLLPRPVKDLPAPPLPPEWRRPPRSTWVDADHVEARWRERVECGTAWVSEAPAARLREWVGLPGVPEGEEVAWQVRRPLGKTSAAGFRRDGNRFLVGWCTGPRRQPVTLVRDLVVEHGVAVLAPSGFSRWIPGTSAELQGPPGCIARLDGLSVTVECASALHVTTCLDWVGGACVPGVNTGWHPRTDGPSADELAAIPATELVRLAGTRAVGRVRTEVVDGVEVQVACIPLGSGPERPCAD